MTSIVLSKKAGALLTSRAVARHNRDHGISEVTYRKLDWLDAERSLGCVTGLQEAVDLPKVGMFEAVRLTIQNQQTGIMARVNRCLGNPLLRQIIVKISCLHSGVVHP